MGFSPGGSICRSVPSIAVSGTLSALVRYAEEIATESGNFQKFTSTTYPGGHRAAYAHELRPLQQKLRTLSTAAGDSQLEKPPAVFSKGSIRNYCKKELHLIRKASGLLTVESVLSTSVEVGQPNESIRTTERHESLCNTFWNRCRLVGWDRIPVGWRAGAHQCDTPDLILSITVGGQPIGESRCHRTQLRTLRPILGQYCGEFGQYPAAAPP